MEYVVVCTVALAASALTLFSGFGLGTLLLPAFLAFFPADEAVALTGIIHLLNNLFKLAFLGRRADLSVVLRFGIPAILSSLAGAWLLLEASSLAPVAAYRVFGLQVAVSPVKALMGALIIFFAVLESRPAKKDVPADANQKQDGDRGGSASRARTNLLLGGVLSGFFGGLSGHQGAFRSAFLLRAGLARDAFIGTGVALACLVDLTRLGVYTGHFALTGLQANAGILLAAGAAALAGSLAGVKMLRKTSMEGIRRIVAGLLMLVGLLLLLGLL